MPLLQTCPQVASRCGFMRVRKWVGFTSFLHVIGQHKLGGTEGSTTTSSQPFHPHRPCGSDILIMWQPCHKEKCGRGEAQPTAARGRDNTALFSTNDNNNNTFVSTQCKTSQPRCVFEPSYTCACQNYQNRAGRVTPLKISSTLAAVSRATLLLRQRTPLVGLSYTCTILWM
jgi:hypothetical protein